VSKFQKPALFAALALCALPVISPAGEAPATSAPATEDTGKKLADAQRRLDAALREVTELSGQMSRGFARPYGANRDVGPPARALLGVGIGTEEGQGGARVLEVSPGGAAAEAGIKRGDLITAIAGADLTHDSNPGRALVEKMRQLEPDLKVQVSVLRDGKKMNFDVVPRLATFSARTMPPMRAMPFPPGSHIDLVRARPLDGMRDFEDPGTRFRGAEFATLSERLGSYFGVKSGVLVVRAGNNAAFKLQDGDVITAIDGREPSSAQHAGRILRSYQPGEKLTIRVQRDRKAQNLEVTAPGGRDDD
jgi:S1-C subfamily serine protease